MEYDLSWISRSNGLALADESITTHDLRPWIKSGPMFYALINISIFLKLLFRKYDVICAIDLDTILPCYFISKIRRKKLIFDAHEYFTEVPELHGRKSVRKVWQKIADFTLPKIAYNYTVGKQLGEIFSEQYGQPYETIMNIGELRKSPNLTRDIKMPSRKKLVYLGALNSGRGIELAIEAVAEMPDLDLLLIGSGDLDTSLMQKVKELGIEQQVEFLGFVSPDELSKHLSEAWVALNLLEPKSKSYYYSLANKFFDYMHCEIPSINMNFPEYRAILDKYAFGLTVEEYSVLALKEGIGQYFDNDLYQKTKEICVQAKGEYNWSKEQEKLLRFYKKMDGSTF